MINKLPKIELHCHLDGSVRVDTERHGKHFCDNYML